MAIATERARITVVTATALEARAARKVLPLDVRVMEGGIALHRVRQSGLEVAISCGLAGGLRTDLPTGTVLVPRSVRRPGGTIVECDAEWSDALCAASRALGFEPVDAPLLTSNAIVHGARRAEWAAHGYAGADMESGLIEAERLACVRVVLDTPQRELSPAWQHPASAIVRPQVWRELPFLAREGPRCAARAAAVLAAALCDRSAR